jgi:hypothetical protein
LLFALSAHPAVGSDVAGQSGQGVKRGAADVAGGEAAAEQQQWQHSWQLQQQQRMQMQVSGRESPGYQQLKHEGRLLRKQQAANDAAVLKEGLVPWATSARSAAAKRLLHQYAPQQLQQKQQQQQQQHLQLQQQTPRHTSLQHEQQQRHSTSLSPADDLLAGLDGTSVGELDPILLNEMVAKLEDGQHTLQGGAHSSAARALAVATPPTKSLMRTPRCSLSSGGAPSPAGAVAATRVAGQAPADLLRAVLVDIKGSSVQLPAEFVQQLEQVQQMLLVPPASVVARVGVAACQSSGMQQPEEDPAQQQELELAQQQQPELAQQQQQAPAQQQQQKPEAGRVLGTNVREQLEEHQQQQQQPVPPPQQHQQHVAGTVLGLSGTYVQQEQQLQHQQHQQQVVLEQQQQHQQQQQQQLPMPGVVLGMLDTTVAACQAGNAVGFANFMSGYAQQQQQQQQ